MTWKNMVTDLIKFIHQRLVSKLSQV